jgi:hypothetical protein
MNRYNIINQKLLSPKPEKSLCFINIISYAKKQKLLHRKVALEAHKHYRIAERVIRTSWKAIKKVI